MIPMTRTTAIRRVTSIAAAFFLAGAVSAACAAPQSPSPAPAAPAPVAAVTPGPVAAGAPSLTCDGQGVEPTASVRYRTERFIAAPRERVWAEHVNVVAWPQWQQAVTTNELLDPGPLHPGSRFRWTTPVPESPLSPATTMTITSTVQQVQAGRCIRWTGPAEAPGVRIDRGVHVWNFEDAPGGTRVITEETHAGPQIEQNIPLGTQVLGIGLEAWLDALKARAESPDTAG
jgi:uncharacterized protein YndB with AHSA1/START domain